MQSWVLIGTRSVEHITPGSSEIALASGTAEMHLKVLGQMYQHLGPKTGLNLGLVLV